ncbi:MAG: LPS export ABC transporter periplasmic protein LptC [Proteobacteria bacterium]|nr:LPS export ABC transporter periplasmic protein LptC [Pseudomonadota bacterium]
MSTDPTRALLDRLVGWSPVLLLGGLAALTMWLNAQIAPPAASPDATSRHEPDTIVERVHAVVFDQSGRPTQVMSADRGEHFPDDNTTTLTAPRVALSDPAQPRLDIAADSGKVTDDRSNVWFSGHVKVVREADKAKPGDDAARPSGPVTLDTERLHLLAQTKDVDSDTPVTIADERGIIRGTGLKMNLDTKAFTLGGPVSGTIQPQALPASR